MNSYFFRISNALFKIKKFDVYYALIIFLLSIAAFLTPTYNWDLDHEMYFGSRLLHGELLWTNEFHDKLPFVPFLFIVPVYLKSIFAFKLISLFLISVTSLLVTKYLKTLYSKYNVPENIYRICTISLPILLYFSHDSYATINCISVSFYTLSFLMVIKENFLATTKKIIQPNTLICGSLFAAIAISIRPYYLPSLGITLILSLILSKPPKNYIKILGKISIWGVTIFLWGFFLNVFPYCITGQLTAFIEGICMLASPINPISGPNSFFMTITETPDSLFWGSWILMSFLIIYGIINNKKTIKRIEINIFCISFFSSLTLSMTIMTQHYWSHYIQLFMGDYLICTISFFVWIYTSKIPNGIIYKYGNIIENKVLPFFLIFPLIFFSVDILKKEIKPKNKDYYDPNLIVTWMKSTKTDWKELLFSNYLTAKYPDNRPDFLIPEDMKAHWMLDEARHHFPHATNTQHVFFGWWEKLNVEPSFFYAPHNGHQYCQILQDHGPTLVVVTPNDYVTPCLLSEKSKYMQDEELKNGNKVLLVFKRSI